MVAVAFFGGALGAIAGAIGVVLLRNPFYSVLALVVHLFSLAGLFLLLHAEFLAVAQILVYAAAVMVLYVFVVAYVGGISEPASDPIPAQRVVAAIAGASLFVVLATAVLGTALAELGTRGVEIPFGFGSPEAIGRMLLDRFLVIFEVASVMLLLSAVAAIVLAFRRREADVGD